MRDHRFHIVCHDCPTEHLSDSERDAARLATDHENAAGHDVTIGRIDCSGSQRSAAPSVTVTHER